MSLSSHRLIARIALAATLFSAVSPALAAALFPHRSDVLAQLLGIPPVRGSHTVGHAASHAHDAHASIYDDHDVAAVPQHATSDGHAPAGHDEHAAHGIYCSFCLNATSTAALPGAPALDCTIVVLADALPVSPAERAAGRLAFHAYSARAPPPPPLLRV